MGALAKHLGPQEMVINEIRVEDIVKDVPLDLNNDGVTDTDSDGNDIIEQVKKQVTIIIKQDNIEESLEDYF